MRKGKIVDLTGHWFVKFNSWECKFKIIKLKVLRRTTI